jgi:hypothetical protein
MKLNGKRGIATLLLMVMVITMTIGFTATVAYANDVTETLEKLQDDDTEGLLGDEPKEKVLGISKDFLDIIMIIVTTVLVGSGVWLTLQFTQVGENATLKSTLKVKLLFHVLGLAFLANYFGLFDFMFNKMGNIF